MKREREAQFTKACEEYSDALFRYCFFKICDREVAKDLVQETYIKTWVCVTRGEDIQNMRAFFYKILGNLVIDYYRKKKAVSLDVLFEENNFEPSFDILESLENKIDGSIAISMLDKLPEIHRRVILLRYVEDLTLEEIADITEESINSVSVKIHRGLKKIKEIFSNQQAMN